MRERPLLFSAPMVRAILDGRKTQTRRVVSDSTSQGNYKASELLLYDGFAFVDGGPSPAGNPGPYLHARINAPVIEQNRGWKRGDCDPSVIERLYPRFFPGDRLWVREAWSIADHDFGRREDGAEEPASWLIHYAADDAELWRAPPAEERQRWAERFGTACGTYVARDPGRNRPSIFMPRWASRITLEISEVRVDRLQEITCGGELLRSDVVREGAPKEVWGNADAENEWFRSLWNSINGERPGCSWDDNPWSWVLSFRRVDSTEGIG